MSESRDKNHEGLIKNNLSITKVRKIYYICWAISQSKKMTPISHITPQLFNTSNLLKPVCVCVCV